MLTEVETAERLKISVNTLRKSRTDPVAGKGIHKGLLPPPVYEGRRVFYAPEDVDAALAVRLRSLNSIIRRKFSAD